MPERDASAGDATGSAASVAPSNAMIAVICPADRDVGTYLAYTKDVPFTS